MKKIIYSLVIMIAAGSLFTSCIEQIEPDGINALRYAKADYLSKLGQLRQADAEKVKAEAAYVDAEAAKVAAETAYQNAKTEWEKAYQALVNEAKQIENDGAKADLEAKIAKMEIELEEMEAAHEIEMVQLDKLFAEAKADFQKTLDEIAAQAYIMTATEKELVNNYIVAYEKWIKAKEAVDDAKADLWQAQYDNEMYSCLDGAVVRDWKAYYEMMVEVSEKDYAAYLEYFNTLQDAVNNAWDEYEKWSDLVGKYEDSIKMAQFAQQEAIKDYDIFKATYIADNYDAFQDAVEEAYDELEFANEAWGLAGKKAKKYDLPKNEFVSDLFQVYTWVLENADDRNIIKYVDDQLVMGDTQKDWEDAMNGGKFEVAATEYKVEGIEGVLDAMNRELVIASSKGDTAGIYAAAADAKKNYETLKAKLIAGVGADEGYIKAQDALAKEKDTLNTKKAELKAAQTAEKEAMKAVVNAVNDVIAAVDNYKSSAGRTGSIQDSTTLVNAMKALAQAKFDYFGETLRDSLTYWVYEGYPAVLTEKKVAMYEMTREGFVQSSVFDLTFPGPMQNITWQDMGWWNWRPLFTSIYGGNNYATTTTSWSRTATAEIQANNFIEALQSAPLNSDDDAVCQAMRNLLDNMPTWTMWTDPEPEKIADFFFAYGTPTAHQLYYHDGKTDPKVEGFYELPFSEATLYVGPGVAEAKAAVTKAEADVTAAEGKVVDAAKDFYKNVYCPFWNEALPAFNAKGMMANPATDSLHITWNEKTFVDPTNIVMFMGVKYTPNPDPNKFGTFSATSMGNSHAIRVVLNTIDTQKSFDYYDLTTDPTDGAIFYNIYTAYGKYLLAEQAVRMAEGMDENLDALKKLNEMYDQIKADYEAEVARIGADKAANAAKKEAFFGKKLSKKAYPMTPDVFEATFIKDGKFNGLGGKQLELAEQYLGEWPATYQKFADTMEKEGKAEATYTAIRNAYEELYRQAYNIQYEGSAANMGEAKIALYRKLQGYLEDAAYDVEKAYHDVYDYTKALEACKAGFDPQDMYIQKCKDDLAIAEEKLALAKQDLDNAKAAYDYVIAKYAAME